MPDNILLHLEHKTIVKIRFGRMVREVTLTAVRYQDRGKQRYIYVDGVFQEEQIEHACTDIPITDVLAKYHNKIVALAFMQEEVDRREAERIADLYECVVLFKLDTKEQKSYLQLRMVPASGYFTYTLDDVAQVQVNHRGLVPIMLHPHLHIHCAVVSSGIEYGEADIVVHYSERFQQPLIGYSVKEPMALYIYVDGVLYERPHKSIS